MVKGKTETGFEFAVQEHMLDDYELLEVLVDMSAGDTTAIVRAVPMLLGSEQAKKLKEHVRSKEGHVSISGMTAEFERIMDEIPKGKKSEPLPE